MRNEYPWHPVVRSQSISHAPAVGKVSSTGKLPSIAAPAFAVATSDVASWRSQPQRPGDGAGLQRLDDAAAT